MGSKITATSIGQARAADSASRGGFSLPISDRKLIALFHDGNYASETVTDPTTLPKAVQKGMHDVWGTYLMGTGLGNDDTMVLVTTIEKNKKLVGVCVREHYSGNGQSPKFAQPNVLGKGYDNVYEREVVFNLRGRVVTGREIDPEGVIG